MNQKLIAKYLLFLRRQHGYTQNELAQKLHVSRQAVSRWETADTLPDLDLLLQLSKLYGITINAILEPAVEGNYISSFEQLTIIPPEKLKEVLSGFSEKELFMACMGASPKINALIKEICPEADFDALRLSSNPVKIEEVENIQRQIVSLINLM